MEKNDRNDLRTAVRLLENPGLSIRLINLLGYPIEGFIKVLPRWIGKAIGNTAAKSRRDGFLCCVVYDGQEGPRQALSIDPSGDGPGQRGCWRLFRTSRPDR